MAPLAEYISRLALLILCPTAPGAVELLLEGIDLLLESENTIAEGDNAELVENMVHHRFLTILFKVLHV